MRLGNVKYRDIFGASVYVEWGNRNSELSEYQKQVDKKVEDKPHPRYIVEYSLNVSQVVNLKYIQN